jgi:hypothetical protein
VLRCCRGLLGPVLNTPETAQLERLDIGRLGIGDAYRLAEAVFFRNLRLLVLNWATVDDLLVLLSSPINELALLWYGGCGDWLPPAGELSLWIENFSFRWQASQLPRLWNFPNCTEACIDAILGSPLVARLKWLRFPYAGPSKQELKAKFGKAITD